MLNIFYKIITFRFRISIKPKLNVGIEFLFFKEYKILNI